MRTALLVIIAVLFAQPSLASDKKMAKLIAKCESGKSGAVCFKAGEPLEHVSTPDLKACKSESDIVCTRKGESREAARARLGELSLRLNEQACAGDHAEGCLRAGTTIMVTEIDKVDPEQDPQQFNHLQKRAEAHFTRGCVLGSTLACQLQGSTGYQADLDIQINL